MTTIQDIARRLGVTKGTVSKALNGAPDISETLQKQILETAVEMDIPVCAGREEPRQSFASWPPAKTWSTKSPTSLATRWFWDSGRWRSPRATR